MRILALDPGVTTGFSTQDHSWQRRYDNDSEPHHQLYGDLFIANADVVVCESFLFRGGQHRVDYTPVEFIGIIKLYCQRESRELIMQNPSDKKYFNDMKIKKLNLWLPGHPHAMDALRHRLIYEMRNGMFDLEKLK